MISSYKKKCLNVLKVNLKENTGKYYSKQKETDSNAYFIKKKYNLTETHFIFLFT